MIVKTNCMVKNTGNGIQVEGGARGFKIVFDEPEELGGTNTGLNPAEGLLTSIAACMTMASVMFADVMNFKFEEVWVEIEGEVDTDGFMGISDQVPVGFPEIRYTHHFKTDEPQERIDAFADMIAQKCVVGQTVKHSAKLVRVAAVKE